MLQRYVRQGRTATSSTKTTTYTGRCTARAVVAVTMVKTTKFAASHGMLLSNVLFIQSSFVLIKVWEL